MGFLLTQQVCHDAIDAGVIESRLENNLAGLRIRRFSPESHEDLAWMRGRRFTWGGQKSTGQARLPFGFPPNAVACACRWITESLGLNRFVCYSAVRDVNDANPSNKALSGSPLAAADGQANRGPGRTSRD
jgi:hypothetical protein